MKKTISKVALVLLIVLATVLCLFACKDQGDKSFSVKVMDGEREVATLTISEGKVIDMTAKEIQKDGYELVGLYTDAEMTTPFSAETAVADDLTLYAKYSKTANYIFVNSNGGSKVEKVEVIFGAEYTVPHPVREGYTFLRFVRYNFETEAEEAFPDHGTYNLSGDARITAEWKINEYTVTFYDGTEKLEEKTVKYGERLTLKTATQKAGNAFVGWFEEKATEKYADNTVITKNVDLYAVYSANKYTIQIVENGGDDANDVMATYGAAFPTLPTMTRTGYAFAGWQKDGAAFNAGATYDFAGGITLVAQWRANTYQILIDENGGDEVLDVTATYGAAFPTLPTVQRTGYTFVGWQKGGAAFVPTANYLLTEGITLVAQWRANSYTLTVYGWNEATIPVTYGETYTLVNPDNTTDPLYMAKVGTGATQEWATFTGYTYNEQAFNYTGTYNYAQSITVYPVKTDNINYSNYKVTFHYGDASKTVYIAMDAADKTIPAAEYPTAATGYTIGAWHVDALDGDLYEAGDVTANLNLYATYTANEYMITIVENGGDDANDVMATYGAAFPTLPTMTRTGYDFNGWQKDGEEFNKGATYTIAGPITLVAQWTQIDYTITIDENGGDDVSDLTSVHYNEAYPLPSMTRTGYTFIGWTKGGEEFVPSATYELTENIILVANWRANTYTITYRNVDDGKIADTQTVRYDEVYSLKSLTRFGYAFEAYTTDAAGKSIVTNTSNLTYQVTDNTTYYVVWEDQTFIKETELKRFKEVQEGDDEYTYVYLTGESYTFEGYEITGSPLFSLNGAKDTMSPVYPGEFTLTLTSYDGERNVIEQKTQKAKIVYTVGMMFMGSDYVAMKNAAKTEGTYQTALNEETYVMSVGAENYKPDVTIRSDSLDTISFEQANIVLSLQEGETALDDSLANGQAGSFNFNSSLVGKTLTVSLHSKYDIKAIPTTLSVKLKINNGINVYTSEDLKAAYGNLSVQEINILRNIKAKLAASDYISGHGEEYGNVTTFTDANDKEGTKAVMTNVNLGAPINDFSHGVYTRVTNNTHDAVTINGNYFVIDGSGLPYINNSVDRYGAGGSNFTAGAGYRIANVQIGIFLYRCADVEPGTAGTIRAYNGGTATVNNLRIEGNNTYDQVAVEDLHDGNSNHLLKMSAAYIGVVVRGGKMYMDNVSIRNTSMGFMLAGDVSGFDKPGVNEYVSAEYIGKPQPGEEQATQLFANGLTLDNSWANSIYAWDLCVVNLTNSKIGKSSGAAIHVDDRPRGGSERYAETDHEHPAAVTPSWLGYSDLETEVVLDIYTAGNINNWVTGQEAWFTAYGKSDLAGKIQLLVDGGVQQATGEKMTVLKKMTVNGVSSNFMNFVFLINEAGDGWTEAERQNDKQGGSSAKLQTLSVSGSLLFYGDNTEMAAIASEQAQSRPYTMASTQPLDHTLTGAIKLLLPIYYKTEFGA